LEGLVLSRGAEEFKSCERFQAIAIDFTRRLFALIAEFDGGFFEGRLCVAKTVAAVGAGELAVDVDGDAGFAGAGAGVVRRENARGSGRDDQGFFFGKEAKRDANGLVLGSEKRSFAIERINQDAAERGCRESEKVTAAHAWESSRGRKRKRENLFFDRWQSVKRAQPKGLKW